MFGRADDAFGFFVETTLYWTLNAGGMWLLAWGCGVVHADGYGDHLRRSVCADGDAGLRDPDSWASRTPRGLPGRDLRRNDHVLPDVHRHRRRRGVHLMYAVQVISQVGLGVWGLAVAGGNRGLSGGLSELRGADEPDPTAEMPA